MKKSKIEFKEGEKHGKATWWFSNGKRAIEGSFTNSKKDGKWIIDKKLCWGCAVCPQFFPDCIKVIKK